MKRVIKEKLKGAWDWVFNPIPKRKIKHIMLDEESVKKHNVIRGLANQAAELKGKLARYEVEEGKRREREKDLEEEEEVKIFLNKNKKEIIRKTMPKFFSLQRFYNKLYKDKKFREKLGIYSFDRSKKLHKFGDMGFTSTGNFVILDNEMNVVLDMPKLNDIFQSVGALGNDIRDGKIPVNLDKEGEWIENFMVYEAPQLTKIGSKLKYQKARKRPVYQIIRDYNKQIGEKNAELEEQDLLITELENKLDNLERTSRVEMNKAETLATELSKSEKRADAVEKNFRDLENEVIKMRQNKEIDEDNLEKLENQLVKMRKEAEREGTKLNTDKALSLIREIRSEIISEMPETTPIEKSIEKKEVKT